MRGALWALWGLGSGCVRRGEGPPPGADMPLDELVESARAWGGLPGVGLAVISGGEVVELAVAGRRRSDDPDPVLAEDAWHLGSDTKAMTATLLAMVVEEGALSWETTLAQAFPEVTVHPELAGVTLWQLLAHQGGMPGDLAALPELWSGLWQPGDPRAQRAWLAAELLARPPAQPPGGACVYSNAGYMIAGAALERATDTPWEALITRRLFEPLGMTGCSFGPPARSRPGPWGHRTEGKALVPVPPTEPGADNPPALGPAGTVSCPLRDWAAFASAHLAGARGDSALLGADSWRRLHTPPAGQDYAGGWVVLERDWARGPALTHSGSNTMFFAVAWLAPGRDEAWLAVTNAAHERAHPALDRLVSATLTR
jgi:D-alanyl-D-alanine carboxypeptidase